MCCSIIGYCGTGSAAPILVNGLRRMEYRGYDSVGVATIESGDGRITVRKGTGKVGDVNSAARLDEMPGRVGIGHTRWSTHGGITDANAHPHPSSSGKIAIVHNGIIKNFAEIKDELVRDGYTFSSETDSEVIANLLQKNYTRTGNIKESMKDTVARLQGDYAFVAMFEDGRMAAARFHEPLMLGVGRDDLFLSSDVFGFIEYTDEAIYVENGCIVIVDSDKITFDVLDFKGSPVKYEITKVSKEFGDTYKGEYAHFTLREIYEQPESVLRAGSKTEQNIREAAGLISRADRIYLTGSGSSYNAVQVAKHLFARFGKTSIETVMSSEFQFVSENITGHDLLIAVSQSGESADVLNAVRIAKNAKCTVIAVTNMLMSSLVHEADMSIGMNCGPEIGVAATKSFTSQMVVMYKIAAELGRIKGSDRRIYDGAKDAARLSDAIARILEDPTGIQRMAREIRDVTDIYVLGRGVHYPIATEAALKIKELTYIHAEGIAGGELKHGPLALMNPNVHVIVLNPDDDTYEEMLTSATETRARGAKIIGISDKRSDVYDYWIEIPTGGREADAGDEVLPPAPYPVLEIIPIQILAYYVALERNTDPDYPRNLAKSVTVK